MPGDISVVGFGDVLSSAHLIPPLTTVRPDFEAVARVALELLVAGADGAAPTGDGAAAGPDPEGETVAYRGVVPVLVDRDSVGPPPG